MFPSSFLDLKNYLLKNIYSPENKSDAKFLMFLTTIKSAFWIKTMINEN